MACVQYYYVIYTALSDAELEAVDEGFDEEFEDKDITEQECNPYPFELGDLDPKQLQQLLEDPHLPNLEDFDLGVEVESEQPHAIMSPSSLRNGHMLPPSSPHQPLVAVPMELNMNQYYNDYNLVESFGCDDPPSVQSNISALTSGSHTAEDLTLGMLSDSEALPDTTPEILSAEEEHCPADSTLTSQQDIQQLQQQHLGPLLTMAAAGLDLTETSNLLSTDTLIELSTALSAETTVETQSMYMFGTGQLQLLPNGTNTSHLGAPAVTEAAQPSQIKTPFNTSRESLPLAPSPQPLPSLASSGMHALFQRPHQRPLSMSPTPSPNSAEQEVSEEDRKLIEMPYYQFRKLLDDPSIPERRKEEIKNVRRRGRNKNAAKLCRHKKLTMIMGLEQEVEQLRKTKSRIALRTHALEKEIGELKRRCHKR